MRSYVQDTAYINKVLVFYTQVLLSCLSSLYIYLDFKLTLTISLCRDCIAICNGAIILVLRMFGLAPLLRSKLTLSTWFFLVAQCSGVFPEESITFNTRSKESKQKKDSKIFKCYNHAVETKCSQQRFRSVLAHFFKEKRKMTFHIM